VKLSNIFVIVILIPTLSFSQIISGTIYNKITNETLPGASVYLNGTTIGDVSDFNGYFELNTNKITNAPLVISYTGFKTIIVNPEEFPEINTIYLEEEENQLQEVILSKDIWSRAKKLAIFRREFLGNSINATQCTIINEKDIKLVYNFALETLTAYCDKPIIIKNRYLGYLINYTLTDFEIRFNINLNGLRLTKSVYTEGYTFFEELHKKTSNKSKKNRISTYNGSIIQFMRSLANLELTENKFDIYYESWPTLPYKYFVINKENGLTKVNVTVEKLGVLYNKQEQSEIIFNLENGNSTFYIDTSGNFFPAKALNFAGVLGYKRIADLLPLNYNLPKD
jgi:hypothetical protein